MNYCPSWNQTTPKRLQQDTDEEEEHETNHYHTLKTKFLIIHVVFDAEQRNIKWNTKNQHSNETFKWVVFGKRWISELPINLATGGGDGSMDRILWQEWQWLVPVRILVGMKWKWYKKERRRERENIIGWYLTSERFSGGLFVLVFWKATFQRTVIFSNRRSGVSRTTYTLQVFLSFWGMMRSRPLLAS